MPDWYLGQAGFGEQLQLYGEMYWRQVGSTLLWAFLVLWALLVLVAVIVALSRRHDRDHERVGHRPAGALPGIGGRSSPGAPGEQFPPKAA